MKKRRLGKSGLQVSEIGLGCNNFGARVDLAGTKAVISKALDLGITLFDTADRYGPPGGYGQSEEYLGQALGDRRKDVILATKFGSPLGPEGVAERGGSRRYVMIAIEASLRRLKTDWIDLYQIHSYDPHTPQEETLRALEDLVRQGKVRYTGLSNTDAWEMVDWQWTARFHDLSASISVQDEYSLLARGAEHDLIPAAKAFGVGLLPYFPLASGLLSGKYRKNEASPEGSRLATMQNYANRYLTEANWAKVEALRAFAEARGHSLLELAVAWLLSRPVVSSVIAGVTTPEQVEANAAASGWSLSAEEVAQLDALTGKPAPIFPSRPPRGGP